MQSGVKISRMLCLGLLLTEMFSVVMTSVAASSKTTAPKISLRVENVMMRELVTQIAHQSGVQIMLIDPPVAPLTMTVEDISLIDLFELIDSMVGVETRVQADVWIVASPDHWRVVERSMRREHRYFTLTYRDVNEVSDWLAPMLSEQGQMEIEPSTNSIWIEDLPQVLDKIETHLEAFDQALPQVLIESRIVIANRDFNRALGLEFGLQKIGSDESENEATARINLPVAGPTGQVNVALLSARYQLDAELSALESRGQGRVISTPRLLVANRAEAFIQQGVAVPFEAVQSGSDGQNGSVSVQFREAALALRATPVILPDGRIQIDLQITQDTVGQIFQTGRGGSVPSIDTRQLGTRVWVNDGQTVVLGGIFQEQDSKLNASVPGLSKLPGLGRLFERSNHDDQRRELLIFITPTLIL